MEGESPNVHIPWFLLIVSQKYEQEGKWIYEQHPFWCTGFTFWDLHTEAPDLFLHLSHSDLVIFKGDLNFRKVSMPPLEVVDVRYLLYSSLHTTAPLLRLLRLRRP